MTLVLVLGLASVATGTAEVGEGGTILGQLRDADGMPLAGVEVQARVLGFSGAPNLDGEEPWEGEPTEVDTDDAGWFVIEGLPVGAVVEARAQFDAWAPTVGRVVVPEPGEQADLELVALAWGGVRGQLLDSQGGLASTAQLVLWQVAGPGFLMDPRQRLRQRLRDRLRSRGTLGADGWLEVDRLAPGTYRYQVEYQGSRSLWVGTVVVRPGQTEDLGLLTVPEPDDELSGQTLEDLRGKPPEDSTAPTSPPAHTTLGQLVVDVVDAEGRPVSGVRLQTLPMASGEAPVWVSRAVPMDTRPLWSDAEGRCALPLEPGRWRLLFERTGYTAREMTIDLAAGELARVTVDLGRRTAGPVRLAGEVVDLAGQPVEGVELRLQGVPVPDRARSVFTGSDGRFVVPLDGPGLVDLEARHPHFARDHRRLQVTEEQEPLTWIVSPGGSIRGAMLGPWHGCEPGELRVQADQGLVTHSTGVDAAGRFHFPGLAPGAWRLVALCFDTRAADATALGAGPVMVEVEGASQVEGVELTVRPREPLAH